ncbi:hypothetical protein EK21DRAFT_60149, partial [Setomelanomma holmii]
NATGGFGNVAAAGSLAPFGDISIGCGVHWEKEKSYGGELQAGSDEYGRGGGCSITPETFTISLGIGINPTNASASINFVAKNEGSFEMQFESSKEIVCSPVPTVDGTKYGISCKTL